VYNSKEFKKNIAKKILAGVSLLGFLYVIVLSNKPELMTESIWMMLAPIPLFITIAFGVWFISQSDKAA